MTISLSAIDLIIEQEVTDGATYRKKYQGFDWPGGDSGPTVGIGYDCGYCKPAEIRADWDGILAPAAIEVLVSASGIKGAAAGRWVAQHRHAIQIPWALAYRQFVEREIPKWEKRLAAVYPQAMDLPPDAKGALLSLIYNRGEGLSGERRREMRAIRDHLAAGRLDLVDDDIRAMVRLWPDTPGLRKRRLREADLFERGVKSMAGNAGSAGEPVAETGGRMRHEPEPAPPIDAATPSDLRPVSRKMTLLAWMRRVLAFFGLGGTGAVTLADITQKSQGVSDALLALVSNPWLVGVAFVSLALVACVGLLEGWSLDDYRSGRWQPSRGSEPGDGGGEPVADVG